jgi:hypothetical protein
MTAPIQHVSTPAELSELCPSTEIRQPDNPLTLRLNLLAPLSGPIVFFSKPQSADENLESYQEHIYQPVGITRLDFSILAKQWREVWAEIPTTALGRVLFDLTLPEPIEGAALASTVYWYSGIPDNQGLVVMEMDPIRLVITMATTMSVRSRRGVVFEVGGGRFPAELRTLRRVLRELSRPEPQDEEDEAA